MPPEGAPQAPWLGMAPWGGRRPQGAVQGSQGPWWVGAWLQGAEPAVKFPEVGGGG